MIEVFNTTYALGDVLPALSQEEIIGTPEFYAMSLDQVLAHPSCPHHLKAVLEALPWSGRPNYVQVRPQDFRRGAPYILGDGFHVDLNTRLANGREHKAKSLGEFRSMVVSFGDVVETEFVKSPMHIDTASFSPFDHSRFHEHVSSRRPETVALRPGQFATYTSRDIHRVDRTKLRIGRARLIIVTVEQDEPLEAGAGEVRPSIRMLEA